MIDGAGSNPAVTSDNKSNGNKEDEEEDRDKKLAAKT